MRTVMSRFLGALLLIASGSVPLAAQEDFDPVLAGDENTLSWHSNLNDAIEEAKLTRKPIFLEFRCAP